jgi:predicted nucleotidyltransferase
VTADAAPNQPGIDETDRRLASEVVDIVRDVLGGAVVGAYLHGSAVLGGLRPTSDLDVLAVVDRPTTESERRAIVERLLEISGRRAHRGPARPVELNIVLAAAMRPWVHPPNVEILYGEWERDRYEAGFVPAPRPMADFAPLIAITRSRGLALHGPCPQHFFDPVPAEDIRRAIVEGLPYLVDDLPTDTRNVLLTFARGWFTLETGEITTKDVAAAWALERIPVELRAPLVAARAMYLEGWDRDDWGEELAAARATATHLVAEIRRSHGDEQEVGRRAP